MSLHGRRQYCMNGGFGATKIQPVLLAIGLGRRPCSSAERCH